MSAKFLPLLSIIVPVYNVEKYLPRCLDSLLAQTYTDLDIVLVDDGSTDSSGAICDRYAELDRRVIAIHKPNSGQLESRFFGIDAATGDYFAFVDSDDYVEPDMFARLMAPLLHDPGIDITIGGMVVEREGELWYPHTLLPEQELTSDEALFQLYSCRSFFWPLWAKVYRRQLFKQTLSHAITDVYGEDFEENTQLFCRAERLYYVPIYGYHYLTRTDSCYNSLSIAMRPTMVRRPAQALRLLGDRPAIAAALHRLLRLYCLRLLVATLDAGDAQAFSDAQRLLRETLPASVYQGDAEIATWQSLCQTEVWLAAWQKPWEELFTCSFSAGKELIAEPRSQGHDIPVSILHVY